MPQSNSSICPNCQHQNHEKFNYCENCGQKNLPIKITFFDFIKDFFDVIFNLDNRFWKTIKYVLVPGKLTKIFYQGKRKSYYHPLRLYVVGVLFLFTILSFLKLDKVIDFGGNLNFSEQYQQKKLVLGQAEVINNTIDSLKEIYNDEKSVALLDTISTSLYLVNGSDTTFINNEAINDSTSITLFFEKVFFSQEEMFTKDIDQVVEDKNITSFLDKLIIKQMLKGMRDVKTFNAYLFANLTWLFLAIIPVFSLVLKIFYIRRKRYYMEHFVFLLHLFTAIIFMSCMLLLTLAAVESKVVIAVAGPIIAVIFPYLAFKNYYQQGIIKTFIKFGAIGFLFMIAFILTLVVFLVISAALF